MGCCTAGTATIVHYDGVSWTAQASGLRQFLFGVWGSGPADVFTVGAYGRILHYDGVSWTAQESGAARYLYAVWGSAGTHVFAVGDGGLVLLGTR